MKLNIFDMVSPRTQYVERLNILVNFSLSAQTARIALLCFVALLSVPVIVGYAM